MARAAGVTMNDCRLLEENGRRHFMTRRFDRLPGGAKLHAQSLCALAHFDYNAPGAYAYEQALLVIRQLGLPMAAVEQQFRRMAFNVIARNQDDHVKNIAFLMDQAGSWSLSPTRMSWAAVCGSTGLSEPSCTPRAMSPSSSTNCSTGFSTRGARCAVVRRGGRAGDFF